MSSACASEEGIFRGREDSPGKGEYKIIFRAAGERCSVGFGGAAGERCSVGFGVLIVPILSPSNKMQAKPQEVFKHRCSCPTYLK
jgi:hypothetical protein